MNVGVADERGEIAALFKGVPQNDIGVKVDIIENTSKDIAMSMLVRTMAPQIIVADEIGNGLDIKAINYAVCSGVKGIFTAHGNCFADITINPIIKELLNLYVIERVIFLDENHRGYVKEIYYLDKKNKEYILKEE
jgi:stage III sporulation protein AA